MFQALEIIKKNFYKRFILFNGCIRLHYSYPLSTYYLLTYLRRHISRAIAAWRQFRIPSVVTFSVTCLAQDWRGLPLLRLPPPGSDSKTLRTGLKLSQPSKTLYFNAPHYIDVIVYIYRTAPGSIVCAILLYRRKVHKSYVGFSS